MDNRVVISAEDMAGEWAWPSGELGPKFGAWTVELFNQHRRQPTVTEIMEWAYQEGVRDGKGRTTG